nr:putative zinc finger, CCHC-type [Tanacetum cinerariifolium]
GIYTLINHYQTVKEIWDHVKELMEGTKMTKQERDSMLYDEFDKFTSEPRESIHSYYLRYAKLINDIKMIPMSMSNMQINSKCMNHLQPECSSLIVVDESVDANWQSKKKYIDSFDVIVGGSVEGGSVVGGEAMVEVRLGGGSVVGGWPIGGGSVGLGSVVTDPRSGRYFDLEVGCDIHHQFSHKDTTPSPFCFSKEKQTRIALGFNKYFSLVLGHVLEGIRLRDLP